MYTAITQKLVIDLLATRTKFDHTEPHLCTVIPGIW